MRILFCGLTPAAMLCHRFAIRKNLQPAFLNEPQEIQLTNTPGHVMTLPKKNRRNMVVDGHKYHWQFDPFRLWGNDSFICVQDASGRGPLLKMQWVGIALPNHIETAIRFARANGWRPDGEEIIEIGADSNADQVAFRLKPDGAPRYWFYDDYYRKYSPRSPNNPNRIQSETEVEAVNSD